MKFSVSLLLAAALTLATTAPTPAAPGCGDTTGGKGQAPCLSCCGCEPVCIATAEPTEEEKHCWCVECKEVGIPAIRCPWEPGGSPLTCFSWLKSCGKGAGCGASGCGATGCEATGCDAACRSSKCCGDSGCKGSCCQCATPKCGEVKCVRDLKKKTYEVDACEWQFEIRRLPACCPKPCGCSKCGRNASSSACQDAACGCALAIPQ